MSQASNIQWIQTDRHIADIYAQAIAGREEQQFTVTSQSVSARINSSSPNIQNAFSVAFPQRFDSPSEARNFYHVDSVCPDLIQTTAGVDIGKPALGLYNPKTQDVLILEKGEFNYGFVNAMVLGFLSKFAFDHTASQYAHAAVINVNGTGILILGDHKAGKSTLMCKILSVAEDKNDIGLSIISDDWVMVSEDTFCAKRVSQEFRIDLATVKNPIIDASKTFSDLVQGHLNEASDKASIPLSTVCTTLGLGNTEFQNIDKIVLLDPQQKEYARPIDPSVFMRIMFASTANVPPLAPEETARLQTFWTAQLTRCETLSINNRNSAVPIETVAWDVINFSMT